MEGTYQLLFYNRQTNLLYIYIRGAAGRSLSHLWLSATPWTIIRQAPLFTKFSRQEYRSGLWFPHPGCTCISLYIYRYIYTHTYICICTYTHICMCMCVCIYVHIYMHVYVYIYIYTYIYIHLSSVRSLSSVQLCNHMDCSMPGLPVHHQLLEFTQAHIHWVGDAIQPSHPLSSPFTSCPQSLPASESFPMRYITICKIDSQWEFAVWLRKLKLGLCDY